MTSSFLKGIVKEIDNEYAGLLSEGGVGDIDSFVDTGSYIFNALVSGSIYGGVPSNKITAIAGESGTGKTFFCMGIVQNYLKENPDAGISDLLSTLDKESASFIGALISTHDAIDEQNAIDYLNDCISKLKKSDSVTRIIELKEIFETGKLSEDETFELQQHLLTNLHLLRFLMIL